MSNVWSNFQFFSTSYCQKSLTVCVCIRRWKISLNSSLKLILPMKKLDFPIKKELPTDKNGRRSQHSKYWDGQSTRPHLISSSTFNWSPPHHLIPPKQEMETDRSESRLLATTATIIGAGQSLGQSRRSHRPGEISRSSSRDLSGEASEPQRSPGWNSCLSRQIWTFLTSCDQRS